VPLLIGTGMAADASLGAQAGRPPTAARMAMGRPCRPTCTVPCRGAGDGKNRRLQAASLIALVIHRRIPQALAIGTDHSAPLCSRASPYPHPFPVDPMSLSGSGLARSP